MKQNCFQFSNCRQLLKNKQNIVQGKIVERIIRADQEGKEIKSVQNVLSVYYSNLGKKKTNVQRVSHENKIPAQEMDRKRIHAS